MTKIIDNTNLGYLISKIKAAFWPKTDVVQIGLDDTPIANSNNLVKSGGVKSALDTKQETLVSGTNIKTINNESLLGSGNISITGGSGGGGEANVIEAITFNGTPATITNKTAAITATIPDAQVQSDWNATSGMGVILNKPDVVQILGVYSVNAGKVFKAVFQSSTFNPQLILVIHKNGNPDKMLSITQYANGDNYFVATDLTGACEYLYQDNGKYYLYQDGCFFGIRAGDSNIKIEVIALYNDLVGIEYYVEDWDSVWADSGYDPIEIQRLATVNQIPAAVTESTVSGWGFTKNTGTYSKPSGGIPATDLASAVQTSLGKADTALQSFTETDPTVPSWAKASTKPTYTASEVGALPLAGGTMDSGAEIYLPGSSSLSETKVTRNGVSVSPNANSFSTVTSYKHGSILYSPDGMSLNTISLPAATGIIALTSDIPSAVTESTVAGWGFTKNSGTLTSETDPVFTASAAHGISSTDISNWNSKQKAITISSSEPTSSQGSNGDIWIVV